MKIAIYTRCSTKEQAEEGVTLDDQRNRLRVWAGLMGHEIVLESEDAGISGAVPVVERPGFAGILPYLESGRCEGVAITALDRLGRSTTDILEISRRFDAKGWSLFSMRDSLDTTTAAGRFMLTILAGAAEFERAIIGERTKSGLAQVKSQGQRYSHILPFGRMLAEDGVHLIDHPDEQRVLSYVIERIKEGHTYQMILADLRRNVGLHPRSGGEWQEHHIASIMRSLKKSGRMPVRGMRPRKKDRVA